MSPHKAVLVELDGGRVIGDVDVDDPDGCMVSYAGRIYVFQRFDRTGAAVFAALPKVPFTRAR